MPPFSPLCKYLMPRRRAAALPRNNTCYGLVSRIIMMYLCTVKQ